MSLLMGQGSKAHNPYGQPRPIIDGRLVFLVRQEIGHRPTFLSSSFYGRRRLQTSQARSFFRPFSDRTPFIVAGADKVCVFRQDMASSSQSEEDVKQRLQELQKQLVKKQGFEQAVSEIRALVLRVYPSSSPPLRKLVMKEANFVVLFFIFYFSILCAPPEIGCDCVIRFDLLF